MNKNFELIKTGIDDNISILSEDQLDEIVGGNFVCKKNFAYTGTQISCGCGYTTTYEPEKPLPGTNGNGSGTGTIGSSTGGQADINPKTN